ncbi:Ig-like domain-containing protein [Carnobacterium gallinarum]|uniref:Ig-like domain-containing protein n=1 Tax=Carnobacterium gallinarum TaxID=2749 RepID=UPI000552CD13|nr:Ig-like domain-containing protein [Carnobacterium gallinarum]
MKRIKFVGLGAILFCGFVLAQSNAEATKVNSLVNFSPTSLLDSMPRVIEEGPEFTAFNFLGLGGRQATANYVNYAAYATTKTTEIRMGVSESSATEYEIRDMLTGATISKGRIDESKIYFEQLSLQADRYYEVLEFNSYWEEIGGFSVQKATENKIPVITAQDKTIYVGDSFKPFDDVTAEDEEDGDLTGLIRIVYDTVDISKAGIYKVGYEVIDNDGGVGTKEIKVTVLEREVELPAPELNPVLNTDTIVEGRATKNTTLHLTIAGDKYETTVGENGMFSVTLDQTYRAESVIEAYVEDEAGHISALYTGTVKKSILQKPVLDKLTDKDLSLSGSGKANTTVVIKIGNDLYETDIKENGMFKMTLDQTYPVGTELEAYILDPANGEKSEVTYAKVVAAEEISLNRVTSIDEVITGSTFADADIKVKISGYRDRVYEGTSDENGHFSIVFTRSYPAGSADPLGEIFVTVNNQVTQGVADSSGNYSVKLSEAIPKNASVSVYQVVKGIKSEPTELTVEQREQ